MTAQRAYLDYNATAPLMPEAHAAVLSALDVMGNPSSVHADGRQARAVVEQARLDVARLVGAKPSEVVFTSGATESNNWALAQKWDTIFCAGVEHASVLSAAAVSGARVVDVPVNADGQVTGEALLAAIEAAGTCGRALLSVQTANNETGILQDVATLAGIAREAGLAVHSDAVQSPGRSVVDFHALNTDFLSISGHKMGAPKGVGALIVRNGVALHSLLPGGGQERRRRGGTENVLGIAGFGAAARALSDQTKRFDALKARRDDLERLILEVTPAAVIIGSAVARLPNTTCVAVPGTLAETLVIKLDLAGVSVSAGSACSSGKVGRSHVLAAMQLPANVVSGAIRVSIGLETTDDEISAFLNAWSFSAKRDAGRAA
jgi:cysteine desulfurase